METEKIIIDGIEEEIVTKLDDDYKDDYFEYDDFEDTMIINTEDIHD